ncbi:hypothetical protein P9112_004407 [Eukaryota sp. TZLM1-RC]
MDDLKPSSSFPVPSPAPSLPSSSFVDDSRSYAQNTSTLSDSQWLFSPYTSSAGLTPSNSCQSCLSRSKKLSTLTSRVEELASHLHDLTTERDSLLVRLTTYDDIITTVKEELAESRERNSHLESDNMTLRSRVSELEQQSAPTDLAEAFAKSEDLYKQRIAELESSHCEMVQKYEEIQSESFKLRDEVSSYKHSLSNAQKSLKTQDQEFNLLKGAHHRLKSGYNGTKQYLVKLMSMMPNLESAAMNGCDLMSDYAETLEKMKNMQESRSKSRIHPNQSADFNRLVSENEELKEQLEATSLMLTEVESTLTRVEEDQNNLETVKKERDDLVAKLNGKDQLIDSQKSKIQQISQELNQLGQKYSTVKKRLKSALTALNEAKRDQNDDVVPQTSEDHHVINSSQTVLQEPVPKTTNSTQTNSSAEKSNKVKTDPELFELRSKLSTEVKNNSHLSQKLSQLHQAYTELQERVEQETEKREGLIERQAEQIQQLRHLNKENEAKLSKIKATNAPVVLIDSIYGLSQTERARLCGALGVSASSKVPLIADLVSNVVKNGEEKSLQRVVDIIQSFESAKSLIEILIEIKSEETGFGEVESLVSSFLQDATSHINQSRDVSELSNLQSFSASWKSFDFLKPLLLKLFESFSRQQDDESLVAKYYQIKSLIQQQLTLISQATSDLFDNNEPDALSKTLTLLSRTQATLTVALELDDEDQPEDSFISSSSNTLQEFRSSAFELNSPSLPPS